MKNIFLGIMVGFCALSAEAATRAVSCGTGPLKFLFRISGAFSQRNVDVRSRVELNYKAGYVAREIDGTGVLFEAGMGAGAFEGLGDPVSLLGNDDTGSLTAEGRRKIFHTLEFPALWPTSNGPYVYLPTALFWSSEMGWRLFQDFILNGDNGSLFSEVKERFAHGERADNFSSFVFGARVEVGFLYDFVPSFGAFVSVGWKFEAPPKDKGILLDKDFSVEDREETLRGYSSDVNKRLLGKAFAHNNGRIASGVKIETKVQETLSVMAGLRWCPVRPVSVWLSAGVRRYSLEATYSTNAVAMPGTPASYAPNFVYDGGKSKLVVAPDKSIKLRGSAWPLAVSLAVGFNVGGVHNLILGVDYCSFSQDLDGRDPDKKKDEVEKGYGALPVENPLAAVMPEDGDIVNRPSEFHQSVAKDVELRYYSTIDVRDVGVVVGYTMTV